jgi:hypothetical protein
VHTKKLFSDSKYYRPVLNVRNFMFDDIDKTFSIKETPSFLIALGLCCYTEYWGKLKLGVEAEERMSSRNSFEKFLNDYLDPTYYPQLRDKGIDIYKDIRCGLAHSYLIEQNSIIDAANYGNHGIEYGSGDMQYRFYLKTYTIEFKTGVNRYINGLIAGMENVELLERCLNERPVLV